VSDSTFLAINKQQVRQNFSRAVNTYDAAAVLQREIADRCLQHLDVIKIQPKIILDLGSGTGYCTQLLQQRFPQAQVIALDLSPSMLQYARAKRGRWQRWRNPHNYVAADIEQLPIAPNSIDLVFSSLALQWCCDLRQTFQYLSQVLTTHGLLLFATLGPHTLKELRLAWQQVDQFEHVNPFLDMHDVGDAMMAAGLTGPVLDMEMLTITYQHARDLLYDLKQLGSTNALQNKPKQLTGKNRLLAFEHAYEQFRCDRVLPASYEVIYGHAWGAGTKQQASQSVQLGKQQFALQVENN